MAKIKTASGRSALEQVFPNDKRNRIPKEQAPLAGCGDNVPTFSMDLAC
jgi:hypothetical protein